MEALERRSREPALVVNIARQYYDGLRRKHRRTLEAIYKVQTNLDWKDGETGQATVRAISSGYEYAQNDGGQTMMRYKGYLGKVDVDGDEFYGTVVNLHRDHVDFRGKTIDEVQQAFRESIDFYLEGCQKDGEEPEKPFSGRFVVRLSSTTHRRASTLARLKDQSLNAVVVEAIEEYLAAQGL